MYCHFCELPVLRTPPTSDAKHPQGPPLGQVKLSPFLSDPKVKYFLLSDSACTLFIDTSAFVGSTGNLGGAMECGKPWPGPYQQGGEPSARGQASPYEQNPATRTMGNGHGPPDIPVEAGWPMKRSGCDAGGGQSTKAALYLSTTKV